MREPAEGPFGAVYHDLYRGGYSCGCWRMWNADKNCGFYRDGYCERNDGRRGADFDKGGDGYGEGGPSPAGVSLAAAVITYFLTRSSANTLVYTIVISVIASSMASAVLNKEKKNMIVADTFKRQKFTLNGTVILGALGMVCLNIGSNISFGAITASMAGTDTFNVDHLTLISSLADIGSSFFGGAPVESIISATANAPHPVWAGVAMMVVVGVILLSGLLPKIGNYVPSSSIAGFLFVLGAV